MKTVCRIAENTIKFWRKVLKIIGSVVKERGG